MDYNLIRTWKTFIDWYMRFANKSFEITLVISDELQRDMESNLKGSLKNTLNATQVAIIKQIMENAGISISEMQTACIYHTGP